MYVEVKGHVLPEARSVCGDSVNPTTVNKVEKKIIFEETVHSSKTKEAQDMVH